MYNDFSAVSPQVLKYNEAKSKTVKAAKIVTFCVRHFKTFVYYCHQSYCSLEISKFFCLLNFYFVFFPEM